jgi:hypothetical protein
MWSLLLLAGERKLFHQQIECRDKETAIPNQKARNPRVESAVDGKGCPTQET